MENQSGSKNEMKPYAKLYSVDSETLKNFTFKLIDGRFAENKNELVISNHIKTNGGVELKIGDKINLNIGTRKTSDGVELRRR